MKLNALGQQQQKRKKFLTAGKEWLYSNLLQALKGRTFDGSGFFNKVNITVSYFFDTSGVCKQHA